jgi:hypothetical protein
MGVNWYEAEQEWRRLVRDQDNAPTELDLPKQNPYDLPGCACLLFAATWFGLSLSTGDWRLIVVAFGTLISLWCVGRKEAAC